MSQPECISREQLERYVLGDLPATDWQVVAAHLETCERCEETVSQLDRAEDTLVKTLRGPAPVQNEPIAYRLAARRAKAASLKAARELSVPRAATQYLRDYELIEPIARGGMGAVYRAVHQRLRREVAVKILPQRCLANPLEVARFQREMQAVGQLRHPAIVQATDGGEVDGVHYLVMELIEGIDLNTLVKCIGPLAPADACELARRTALGLAHAHKEGVIHRDVKPSNVMLTADGDIKILDLGLARIVGEQMVCDELTTVGQLMGTVDYMAPEQFENSHNADERCDVYGLGATLYKLVAGQVPYGLEKPDSPLGKLRRIAAEPPPPLLSKRGDVPIELGSLVDRMIARRAEDRPANMQEVATALEPWSAGHNLRDLARDGVAKQAAASHRHNETRVAAAVPDIAITPSKHEIANGKDEDSRPRSNRFRWSIACLLLVALLGALGIVITLQTSNGQLVIETTVPDIEVRIVRAGQPFKTLTLTQQPNTLRLGAGDYEIQIVGPSDGISVENNVFTLTRGQTVVSRIVHTVDPAAPPPTVAESPRQAREPRYDGKTTSEWISVLLEDRSPQRVVSAFEALQKLGLDNQFRNDALQAIFEAAPYHQPGQRTNSNSTEKSAEYEVWAAAVATLRSFDEQSVMNHVTKTLVPGNPSQQFTMFLLQVDSKRYRVYVNDQLQKALLALTMHGSDQERAAAIETLASLLGSSSPEFLAICRNWLSEKNELLRLHGAHWLAMNKQSSDEVVKVLRQILKSESREARSEAISILRNLGRDAAPAVPDLIAIVQIPDQLDLGTVQSLITERGKFNFSPQEEAIAALGNIGDTSAVPTLFQELQRRTALAQAAQQSPNERLSVSAQERAGLTNLMNSIQAITGLRYHTSASGSYWAASVNRQHQTLAGACDLFLKSTSVSSSRQESREDIQQLMLVSTEADVENALSAALFQSRSREAEPNRLTELVDLLRPKLPAKSECRAQLRAMAKIAALSGVVPNSNGTLTFNDPMAEASFRSIQRRLQKLAASSREFRDQTIDVISEDLISIKDAEFLFHVDTLLVLEIPDPERIERLISALEKAKDPEIQWKVDIVKRGIEHLRGKPQEPQP